MASVRTLARMKRGGISYPRGSIFHDFDLDEAKGLKGFVEIIDEADALSLAEIVTEVPAPPAPAEPPVGDVLLAPSTEGASSAESPAIRVNDVRDALDLLDDTDWVSAGPRKGRPKVGPLADILGFKPTDAEVSAALALREAM